MRRVLKACLLLIVLLAVSTTCFGGAASADAFNSSRIIDDAIFDNSNSMAAGNINAFLNQFPYSCISPNSGFQAVIPSGYSPSGGYSYGGYASAGDVITRASQIYGINPQVLVATLEKEQSLVTGQNSASYCTPANDNNHKYAAALGYACNDGGTKHFYTGLDLYRRNGITQRDVGPTCVSSPNAAGFSQQVIRAAWLLRFGEQRSKGNIGWNVQQPNWDNSDDPQTCYGGPMTQGTFKRGPSACGSATFYDGYTSIDGVGTHMDSGATAALYWYTPHFHGNQVFFNLFSSWFGPTTLSFAFKSSSSATVYIYVNGYKVLVPAMGMLQDYGISPNSIQTLSQSTVDNIPVPDLTTTGISPTLSYLVKSPSDSDADGGSLYLIAVGKKQQFSSLAQVSDFGFDLNNISYLPLSFLQALPGNSMLSNYISTPTSSAFQVSGGQKRIIFDYPTYIGLNPSNFATPVSYYTAGLIPSGKPIANREILVKYSTGDSVYLYANSTYYAIPTFDAYKCWGFDSTLGTPVYTVPDNTYLSPITPAASLSCLLNDGSGTNYLLSRTAKYTIPASYGIANPQTTAADLLVIANGLPTNSSGLTSYIRGKLSPTVWFLEAGAKKQVPTYSNYVLLNVSPSQLTFVDDSALSAIPTSPVVKLGVGQIVKSDAGSEVYAISGNSRIMYATSDTFLAYGNNWTGIETYSQSMLDQNYPYSGQVVSKYFYDQAGNNLYLVDPNGCYKLSAALQTSYNQTGSGQPYTISVFPNLHLSACQQPGSVYVKQPGISTIYWIDAGQKHPVSSWNTLIQHSGTANPYIINVSASTLQSITTGSTL